MENSTCGKFRLWKIPSVENSPCGKFPLWKIPPMENSPCGKFRQWKTPPVENSANGKFPLRKISPTENSTYGQISYISRNENLKIYFSIDSVHSASFMSILPLLKKKIVPKFYPVD